jgi:glycosyltransferase involved in cell wall biosynthesis
MRVLHVVNYGWPYVDGYTVRTAGLVTAQRDELGWQPHVLTGPFEPFARARDEDFTTGAWGPDAQRDVTVTPPGWERPAVGVAPRSSVALEHAVTDAIDELAPDVVHTHHPHQVARPAIRAARDRGVPVVHEVRCFNGDYDLDRTNPYARLRGRWTNHLEMVAARAADEVVTIADGLARRLAEGGVRDAVVVRNSVDTGRFHAEVEPGPRPDVRLHVGYATTFEHIEGLDLLVDALALVAPKLADDDLHVTLAGAGRDRDRIQQLVAAARLDHLVSFPGFVPVSRMPGFHRALDVFLVTRHDAVVVRDTTPLKPLEAIAVGTPVWAADVPAMRELLDGRPGTQVYPPTPDALAERLLAAVAAPPPRLEPEIGDRSWQREVHRYREVYDRVAVRVAS